MTSGELSQTISPIGEATACTTHASNAYTSDFFNSILGKTESAATTLDVTAAGLLAFVIINCFFSLMVRLEEKLYVFCNPTYLN